MKPVTRVPLWIVFALGISAQSAMGQLIVLDPSNLEVNKHQVRLQLEVIERMDEQIHNQLLIVENWAFTRLAGFLTDMQFVRAPLQENSEVFAETDLAGALETQYPINSQAYAHRDTEDMDQLRQAWLFELRATLVLARTVQNRVFLQMAPTQTRIDEYVLQSNTAAGPTAATQAGNEILATLIAQLQAIHAREIAEARAELEREAQSQAQLAFCRQRKAHVTRDWKPSAKRKAESIAQPLVQRHEGK